MWLAPAFSLIANAAARVYYRLTIAGERAPARGPVLFVANHPNSLIDPLLVCAAARRPVRFLAKAPLFGDAKTGWMVRAVGAIPVYRRQDDPALMDRNADMFRAAHDALGRGAAVGIFPEGQSHSEPSMVQLRTGAARILLGTLAAHGVRVPIVPVGLVFHDKAIFRSPALVVVGEPVPWEDAGEVRELTERIATALREVTLNLERWEDRPLVETAVAIWDAEFESGPDRARRLHRALPGRRHSVRGVPRPGRARQRGGDGEGADAAGRLQRRVSRHREHQPRQSQGGRQAPELA